MSHKYAFDEATVQIMTPGGENIAIFDVSATTECRWVAINNKGWSLLETFKDVNEMLEFVAHKQDHGAEIPNTDGWLDDQAGQCGYDSWDDMVRQVCGKNDPPEFPVYYDAQGNEHAEY